MHNKPKCIEEMNIYEPLQLRVAVKKHFKMQTSLFMCYSDNRNISSVHRRPRKVIRDGPIDQVFPVKPAKTN